MIPPISRQSVAGNACAPGRGCGVGAGGVAGGKGAGTGVDAGDSGRSVGSGAGVGAGVKADGGGGDSFARIPNTVKCSTFAESVLASVFTVVGRVIH